MSVLGKIFQLKFFAFQNGQTCRDRAPSGPHCASAEGAVGGRRGQGGSPKQRFIREFILGRDDEEGRVLRARLCSTVKIFCF